MWCSSTYGFFLLFIFSVFTFGESQITIDNPLCQLPEKKGGPSLQQLTQPFEHGEEPHWDPKKQVLYFVDIHVQNVLCFNPNTHAITELHLEGGPVTPVIPVRDASNYFVVGIGRNLSLVQWDGQNTTLTREQIRTLSAVESDKPTNRFNDGKADTEGRVWIGTIGYENSSGVVPNQAALYRMSGQQLESVSTAISPVTNSNGLAWNMENTKFYYIDTPTRKIAVYDYNSVDGTISNRQIAFDLENYDIGGSPDGMTIDTDGNLWIALYLGGAVIKVNPTTGELLQRIAIPASQVTSTMFGGTNLDQLYVTTSKFGLTSEELAKQPAAGALFRLSNLNAKGFPANSAVVRV